MIPQALAINWDSLIDQTAPNLGGQKNLGTLVGGGGNFPGLTLFISFIAGGILVIYLLYGGLILLTSKGNPKAVEAGKKTITNALVGFILVFTAYWIVQLVGITLGLQGITNVFKQ